MPDIASPSRQDNHNKLAGIFTSLDKPQDVVVCRGMDRDRISGTVQVDECFVGGIRPGKRGVGAGGKTLLRILAESLGQYSPSLNL